MNHFYLSYKHQNLGMCSPRSLLMQHKLWRGENQNFLNIFEFSANHTRFSNGPQKWNFWHPSAHTEKTRKLYSKFNQAEFLQFFELEHQKMCKNYLNLLKLLKYFIINAWNAFSHLFLRLKGANSAIFQAFSAEYPKNFGILVKFQMA